MRIRYTRVTRSTKGPEGQTEIGFMSSHGSDVYVSKPEPGEPLPFCHDYPDDVTASLNGWRGAERLLRSFQAN
jgi:hypothetical protein